MTEIYRFVSKIKKVTSGCWEWTGATRPSGYGSITVNRKTLRVHRHSYELFVGKIPDGLVIDHICRNRICVNPEHLEVVTSKENNLRGFSPSAINTTKTKCLRGHDFTEVNTLFRKNGGRACRECTRVYTRDWRKKKRLDTTTT